MYVLLFREYGYKIFACEAISMELSQTEHIHLNSQYLVIISCITEQIWSSNGRTLLVTHCIPLYTLRFTVRQGYTVFFEPWIFTSHWDSLQRVVTCLLDLEHIVNTIHPEISFFQMTLAYSDVIAGIGEYHWEMLIRLCSFFMLTNVGAMLAAASNLIAHVFDTYLQVIKTVTSFGDDVITQCPCPIQCELSLV